MTTGILFITWSEFQWIPLVNIGRDGVKTSIDPLHSYRWTVGFTSKEQRLSYLKSNEVKTPWLKHYFLYQNSSYLFTPLIKTMSFNQSVRIYD